MMWPGVKGSTAKRVSTATKAIAKGMVAQREAMVRGLRHERLLPRSRPNSRVKIVRIRSKAPRMSMRGSCFLHGVSDCRFGRWRKKPTEAIVIRHRNTWMRKALPSISALVLDASKSGLPSPANSLYKEPTFECECQPTM